MKDYYVVLVNMDGLIVDESAWTTRRVDGRCVPMCWSCRYIVVVTRAAQHIYGLISPEADQ